MDLKHANRTEASHSVEGSATGGDGPSDGE